MNNLDKEIQRIVKQDIEMPKEYRNNIQKTLENCIQNSKYRKKKNRITSTLKKIGLTILVGATAITAYATGTKNFEFAKTGLPKIDENYQESAVDINQTIENEYLRITLDSMAADESYIIAEFVVEFKEKAINEYGRIGYSWDLDEEMPRRNKDWFGIYNVVSINSQFVPQSWKIEKISETKFLFTDIIGKMGIEDEELNVKIYMNNLISGGEYQKGIYINKGFQLKIKYNESRTKFMPQEKILDENNKIIIKGVANTKFETYVSMQKITENITYEQYNKPYLSDSFIITDMNDQEIKYELKKSGLEYSEVYIKNNKGEQERVKNISELNEKDIITVVQDFTIILGKNENLETVKIIPITTTSYIYDNRLKMYENGQKEAIWYPLVEGENKYSKSSTMGGKIEIQEITIDDENITFTYNQEGIIGEEYIVVIRDKTDPYTYSDGRYIIADRSKRWGDEGNIEVFSRKHIAEKFDNVENLEFSLLFGYESHINGETIELEIPKQNDNIADLGDVKDINGKVVTLDCSYEEETLFDNLEHAHTYKIFYDENDKVLYLDEFIDDMPCYTDYYYDDVGLDANVNELIEKFKKEYEEHNGKCEVIYE